MRCKVWEQLMHYIDGDEITIGIALGAGVAVFRGRIVEVVTPGVRLLSQRDPRWAAAPLGASTIGRVGCYITCPAVTPAPVRVLRWLWRAE